MCRHLSLFACAALVSSTLIPQESFAQSAGPTSIEPGRIERQFREPVLPRASAAPLITTPDNKVMNRSADTTFVLKSVNVEGNEAISDAELVQCMSPIWARR